MVAAMKLVGDESATKSPQGRAGRGLFGGDRSGDWAGARPIARAPRAKRGAERRVFPRKDVEGRVMGRRLDHSVDAHRQPAVHLSMRDLSVGGLRAQSQGPLDAGEHVVVFFPPEGALRGWDAYGRVVRCHQKPDGKWEVALEFDPLPAA